MEQDEKIFKGIELSQARIKIIADLGIKGIIFHLGITAFSITFAFRETTVPKMVIHLSNAIITLLALISTVLIIKDFQKVRNLLLEWHRKVELEIHEGEFKGIIWAARLYSLFCVILIAFWITLLFIPLK